MEKLSNSDQVFNDFFGKNPENSIANETNPTSVKWAVHRRRGKFIDKFLQDEVVDYVKDSADVAFTILDKFDTWKENMENEIWMDGTPYDRLDASVVSTLSLENIAARAGQGIRRHGELSEQSEQNAPEHLEALDQWKMIGTGVRKAIRIRQEGEWAVQYAVRYLNDQRDQQQTGLVEEQDKKRKITEISDRYVRAYLQRFEEIGEGALPNQAEGARIVADTFPDWRKAMASYAASADQDVKDALDALSFGSIINLAGRIINFINENGNILSVAELQEVGSIKYWKSIRSYAGQAQYLRSINNSSEEAL
ncbi:MAG TPA: hypothetical protein VG917_05095 [Patescibacteria group bacterium]|nr:hypothetical protein [Patescibacteria group bacterium]